MVSLAIRLLGLGLSFVQGVLTARLLGAQGYGTVAAALSIAVILSNLALIGLAGLAVREVPARLAAGDAAGLRAFARFALAAVLLTSVAASATIAVLASETALFPEAYRVPLSLGALLIPPLALIPLFRGLAQGFGRIGAAQTPGELLRPALMVLVMVASLLAGLAFSVADFMWATAGAALAAAALGGWLAWRALPAAAPLRATASERRRWLAESLPFLGLGVAAILQGEINTLLLSALAGSTETGLFQPVARLAPIMTLPVQAAGMRFAPRVAEFWQASEVARLRQVTGTFTWTTTALTAATAVGLAAAGPWLMAAFGPEFRQSAPLLWYIAAAQVFNAACGPVGMLLNMTGRTGAALTGQLTGLLVNCLLGLWLIPKYGTLGAVLAMSAGVIVWNVVLLAAARQRLDFNPSVFGLMQRQPSE